MSRSIASHLSDIEITEPSRLSLPGLFTFDRLWSFITCMVRKGASPGLMRVPNQRFDNRCQDREAQPKELVQ
jgi:hypothetical protein